MLSAPRLRLLLGLLAVAGLACHDVHFEPHVTEGEIDLYDDLYAVSVADDKTAVAAGYMGAIYTTSDSGTTWQKSSRSEGPARLYYGVSMADPLRGWIVGQLGTVLRSEDGGASWTTQETTKSDYHLFAVHAMDDRRAWAVGEFGTRILTEDGGQTWQDSSLTITLDHPQYVWLTPPEQERVRGGEKVFEDVSLNDIYCRPVPSQRCWIVGEFGYIFYSEDLGASWQRADIVGTDEIEPVYFGFDESEVGDEDSARVRAFVESILDQEHLNVLIEPFASQQEVRAFVEADDPTPLFDILDSRMSAMREIAEETGILSDRLRKRGTPPWDYEDFLEDDPEFLTRFLDSRLAERPQVAVAIAQNPYLFRVRFRDDMNGIITGLGGVVLVSDDGGLTWSYGSSGVKRALYAMAPGDERSIAVGEKGLARFSGDGGRTWSAPPEEAFPEVFTFMRDVSYEPQARLGLIVGQRGLVLRSTDQGDTWTKVLPPPKTASAE
jgi:photosystem II stability/assembly factor-like uncharacterized protein